MISNSYDNSLPHIYSKMEINSQLKNKNQITLLTYYLPVYSQQGKCNINAKKFPRKLRLLNIAKKNYKFI